jgi:hypothetical protein
MSNILQEFVMDLFSQIFGFQKPRTGRLILSMWAHKKMEEYQLDFDTIDDTFRYGDEVKDGMIVRQYANNSVGIIYKLDDVQPFGKTDKQYVITTCWKRHNWHA